MKKKITGLPEMILPTEEQKERFARAVSEVLGGRRDSGIGTLSEKNVHAVLKRFYEPLDVCHERKVGRYVADIVNEHGITEIQTRAFFSMKEKLAAFLEVCPVTLVHPVLREKRILTTDKKTGELISDRISPKKGSVFCLFEETGSIPELLRHPNLTVCAVLIDAEELRTGVKEDAAKPKRKRQARGTVIPAGLVGFYCFSRPEDYIRYLPREFAGQPFTVKKLSAALGTGRRETALFIRTLQGTGAVERCGSEGRAYLYRTAAASLPEASGVSEDAR